MAWSPTLPPPPTPPQVPGWFAFQTVDTTGIPSAEAFGTATLLRGNVNIVLTGIASQEAFGTLMLGRLVAPTGIASAEAFGLLKVGYIGAPVSIVSQEAFGTAVLTTGNVNVAPTGIASAEAFGTPTITRGGVNVAPGNIASSEAFGTAVLTRGNVNVAPTGIASVEAFGTAKIVQGIQGLTGIPSAEAFGTPMVGYVVQPAGVLTAEAFGTPVLTTGNVNVAPTGIASAEAFGTATVVRGNVNLAPTSIASLEAFGTPQLNYTAAPVGIVSGEAFGTAVLSRGNVNVAPTGIASQEAFGTATVGRGNVNLAPTGIASLEAFGTAVLTVGNVNVAPTGIASAEAFGTATLAVQLDQAISAVGNIGTAEAFGTATVGRGNVNVAPTGIVSAEAFGTAVLTIGNVNVAPTGIASAEAFGTATVGRGNVNVAPTGIASAEAFGTPVLIVYTPMVLKASSAGTGNTITIPAHVAENTITIMAYRDGNNTAPSVPAAAGTVPAWETKISGGANTNAMIVAQFVATSNNHTSGTWANATGMFVMVHENADPVMPSAASAIATGAATGPTGYTAPALPTQADTTGISDIIEFYGARAVTAWDAAPSGYTRLASAATEVAANSKDVTTSDGSSTQTATGSSSGWAAAVLEMIERPQPAAVAIEDIGAVQTVASGTAAMSTTVDSTAGSTIYAVCNNQALGNTGTMTVDGSPMTLVANSSNGRLSIYKYLDTTGGSRTVAMPSGTSGAKTFLAFSVKHVTSESVTTTTGTMSSFTATLSAGQLGILINGGTTLVGAAVGGGRALLLAGSPSTGLSDCRETTTFTTALTGVNVASAKLIIS